MSDASPKSQAPPWIRSTTGRSAPAATGSAADAPSAAPTSTAISFPRAIAGDPSRARAPIRRGRGTSSHRKLRKETRSDAFWRVARQGGVTILARMAKDTEKLIRQLSLISFLMAQGRPVSALEIKREVEGYSDMNEDALARRFYADRAELESLGIDLQVEKPGEGFFEAELYSLPPENFYLPAIQFSDDELAALRTALSLLSDGGFAYAEPLRLALQQVAWGHPNPIVEEPAPVEMAMTASAGGRELSQRLSKIETAISRRKTIEFTYYTMERDETAARKVDPYHLV